MLPSSVPWVLLLGLCMTSCASSPETAPEISPLQRFQQERDRENEAEFLRLERGCFAESKVDACESLGWLGIRAHGERICQSQIRSCSMNGFFGCGRIFEQCTTLSNEEKIAAMEKALVEMCGTHRKESCERLSREYASGGRLSSIVTVDKTRFLDNARCAVHEDYVCKQAIKNELGRDQPDKALELARSYACEQPGNIDTCDVQASYYLIKVLLDYSVRSSEKLRAQAAPLLQQTMLLLYNKGCLFDDKAACNFLASDMDWSRYPQESKDQFLILLDKDCTRNSRLNACLLLARRSNRAAYKRLGPKLALLCRTAKGREAACFNEAGEALDELGPDQQRKYLFQQACLGGEIRGCEHWAEEIKWDSHPNYKSVAQALRVSCKGEEKCLLHAGMILTQADDTKDSALLLNPLCNQGNVEACEAVALGLVSFSSAKDRHRGATLLQDLCEKGRGVSCFSLSRLYALGKGGLKQSTGFAEEAAQKACNLGVREACARPDVPSAPSYPSSRGYSSWGSTAEQLGSAGKALGGLVISPALLPFCLLGIKRNSLCPLSW